MCKARFRIFDRGAGESRVGNEDPTDIPSPINADKMRSNLLSSDRLVPPLHLYEVENTAEFDSAIDLLDDSLPFLSFEGESLSNEESTEAKQAVEHGLPRGVCLAGAGLSRRIVDNASL